MPSRIATAEVLARAWNAARLYGADHPACRTAVRELAAAAAILAKTARLVVGGSSLALDGEPLAPASLYGGIAQALREAGIAEIEIHRSLDENGASRLVELLSTHGRAADGAAGSLAMLIAQATGNAVKARGFTAGAFTRMSGPSGSGSSGGSTSIASGTGGPKPSSPRLHDLPSLGGSSGGGHLPKAVADLLERVTEPPASAGDGMGAADQGSILVGQGEAERGASLACLNAALTTLSEKDQALIVQMLSHDQAGSYDDAVAILDRMPVLKLVDAIAVLGRSDGHFNSTSLMLLKRLGNLAIGSPTDLQKLAEIADTWGSEDADAAGDGAADAAHTARLLKRIAESDFRSDEYTSQLRELLAVEGSAERGGAERLHDDFSQLARRAVEIVCDTLADPDSGMEDQERGSALDFLRGRCAELAANGALDALRTILKLAAQVKDPQGRPTETAAAVRLSAAERSEHWTAMALGRCGSANAIAEHLKRVHPVDVQSAPALLVRAASFACTPAQRAAVIQAARRMDAAQLLHESRSLAGMQATLAAGLCFLVQALSPESVIGFMKPSLLGHDSAAREAAYLALAQTPHPWPLDLCVRGLADENEAVRTASAGQIAKSHPRYSSLFVDRLIGRLGHAEVTPGERDRLQALLAGDRSALTTRCIAWPVLVNSWKLGGSRIAEALLPLLASRPATFCGRAALIARQISPFRLVRTRKAAA